MESLIEQVPVSVGDMIYVDAGTIHAIGPGVVLLETQQTSDITYRLYDYGRPRELHLEQGLRVVRTADLRRQGRPADCGWLHPPDRAEVLHRGSLRAARRRLRGRFPPPTPPASPAASSRSPARAVSAPPPVRSNCIPGKAVVLPANSTNPTIEATSPLVVVHCFEPRSI